MTDYVITGLVERRAALTGEIEAELKRRGISYRQLAERLEEMGIHESERNINNKISRGGFSATFFVQCLIAAGCTTLHLNE